MGRSTMSSQKHERQLTPQPAPCARGWVGTPDCCSRQQRTAAAAGRAGWWRTAAGSGAATSAPASDRPLYSSSAMAQELSWMACAAEGAMRCSASEKATGSEQGVDCR